MSNKPRKHSERKGETAATRMKREWSKRRMTPFIPINPQRHLIVTEGTKTEPLYFEAIKRRINARYHGQWVTVDIVGAGEHTGELLEHAQRLVGNDAAGFSHVWLVFDKDSFMAEEFNDVVFRCDNTRIGEAQFHAIWSNECFELWYILHFEYLQLPLSRDDYGMKISKYLNAMSKGEYSKSRDDMFALLESNLAAAKHNAAKLEKLNIDKTPADSVPGTLVHHLIEQLEPFFVKAK